MELARSGRAFRAQRSPFVGQQGCGFLGPRGGLGRTCRGGFLPGGPGRMSRSPVWSRWRVPLWARKRASPTWLLRRPASRQPALLGLQLWTPRPSSGMEPPPHPWPPGHPFPPLLPGLLHALPGGAEDASLPYFQTPTKFRSRSFGYALSPQGLGRRNSEGARPTPPLVLFPISHRARPRTPPGWVPIPALEATLSALLLNSLVLIFIPCTPALPGNFWR